VITWIVLRAAGIGAYLMLFGSVAWGLISTTSLFGKKVAKATAVSVHQFLSTVALVLLGVHLGGLLLDRFVPFKPLDFLVPFHNAFRPVAVTFGIVAMYLTVIVLVSSWTKKHLGTKVWRSLHLLATPAWVLSMVHGVFTGTDTVRPWMYWIYASTGAAVLFLLLVRAFTHGVRPQRAALPEGARAKAAQRAGGGFARAAELPVRVAARAGVPESRQAVSPPPELPPAPDTAVPPNPVAVPLETGQFPSRRSTLVAGGGPLERPAAAPTKPAGPLTGASEVVVRLELHLVVDQQGRSRIEAVPAEPVPPPTPPVEPSTRSLSTVKLQEFEPQPAHANGHGGPGGANGSGSNGQKRRPSG